jgi:hypothetical protein
VESEAELAPAMAGGGGARPHGQPRAGHGEIAGLWGWRGRGKKRYNWW